jgi:hypothetical protein
MRRLEDKHVTVFTGILAVQQAAPSCFFPNLTMSSQLRREKVPYHVNIVPCCYNHSISSVVLKEAGSCKQGRNNTLYCTKEISLGGKGGRVGRVQNLAIFLCRLFRSSATLSLLESQGPVME